MVIYRCDCCKKDVPEKSDLFRITLYSEKYDTRKDFLCFMPHLSRIENEVCVDCLLNLRTEYFGMLSNGGVNNETRNI